MKRHKSESHLEGADPAVAGTETEAALIQAETVAPEVVEATAEPVVEIMESVEATEAPAGGESAFSFTQILPAMSEQASKAVYGAFYYTSYSIVFGTLMVAHMIPMNNIIGQAIKKGADDARTALEKSAAAQDVEEQMPPDAAAMGA